MIIVLLAVIALMFGLGAAVQAFGYYLLICLVLCILAASMDA